jgi:hypothetical protein
VCLWVVAGSFMIAGGTWIAELACRASEAGDVEYIPLALGALAAGLTLSRAFGRGAPTVALAASLLLATVQGVALAMQGTIAPWTELTDAGSFALFAGVTTAGATLGAVPRLAGAPEHRLLWLWISSLLTLGCMVNGLMFTVHEREISAEGVVVILVAPVVAGVLTQLLVARRMIWTCGGGALMFVLIIADQGIRMGDTEGLFPSMLGAGMFVLFGALGARVAWRMQHGVDYDLDRPAILPTATSR